MCVSTLRNRAGAACSIGRCVHAPAQDRAHALECTCTRIKAGSKRAYSFRAARIARLRPFLVKDFERSQTVGERCTLQWEIYFPWVPDAGKFKGEVIYSIRPVQPVTRIGRTQVLRQRALQKPSELIPARDASDLAE